VCRGCGQAVHFRQRADPGRLNPIPLIDQLVKHSKARAAGGSDLGGAGTMSFAARRSAERLKELRGLPDNKRCFDCESLGTTYYLPQFSVFVCTACSGSQ
jgi:hypothetical protein